MQHHQWANSPDGERDRQPFNRLIDGNVFLYKVGDIASAAAM